MLIIIRNQIRTLTNTIAVRPHTRAVQRHLSCTADDAVARGGAGAGLAFGGAGGAGGGGTFWF